MESEMATVTVKKEEEEDEDDSSQQPAAVEDDCSQQHYLIPGYNMIFIKEDPYDEQEAGGSAVKSEPEMWHSNCSTSGRDYATEMATVTVKKEEEEDEVDSSQQPAAVEDDCCQQHYLIPGYNMIFIKEDPYDEQEAEGSAVKSEPEMWHSNCSTSGRDYATEMATVTVKKEEEEDEDDSSQQPAAVEDDCSQQNYLIPGYNMIFIKEDPYDEQEAEGSAVKSEPEMWPSNCSTSGRDYATEMATVTVKKEEEEDEDDSSQQPAAVEDDCSQQNYLIPGYNMIFIKEDPYDDDSYC
ncbi:uncharacterized protein LOC111053229 isoform X11 [Nilaparvata lugens]|uniref:uncharacterized protein LOC111053229 isoform X11 n=1 Tax=Nilaparvata lugens TaxID=108931 RepID=UPI00193E4B94|nr:uncharacterized protein LOC111053229 isoform X11 [Nilaparvata lugens]